MNELRFIAEPLLFLSAFATAFYFIGCGLNRWFLKLDFTQGGFFIHSVIGMGYTILISHLLLSINLFNTVFVLLTLALPLVFSLKQISPIKKTNIQPWIHQHFWFIVIFLLYFLPETFRIFKPEVLHDAIAYHLPYAREFADKQGLTINTYLRYPLNVLNFDLMFSLGYLFNGEILARLFNVYSTFLLGLGMYVFAMAHLNKMVALLAVWAFWGMDMVASLMISGYIDLALSLFIFSAIFMLTQYQKYSKGSLIVLSGFFFGLALGTKYLALLVLPMYLVWLMVCADKKVWWKAILAILIIGSPWYLRNMWYAGNPVHPFAQQFFGFWLWTPADLLSQQADLSAHHHIEQSWSMFFKLPLLFLQDAFNKHGSVNHILVLGMALIPVGLCVKGLIRQISLFCLVSLILWFFSSQIARYLLYVFPFLLIISAYFISYPLVRLVGWEPIKQLFGQIKSFRYNLPIMLLILLVVGTKVSNYYSKLISKHEIATNQVEWQQMLEQKPFFQLAQQADYHAQEGTFLLSKYALQLYFDGPAKGDWYGVANMFTLIKTVHSTEQLIEQMNHYQVDVLLIEDEKFFNYILPHIDDQFFTLIFQNKMGRVFQLKTTKPENDLR